MYSIVYKMGASDMLWLWSSFYFCYTNDQKGCVVVISVNIARVRKFY